MPRQILILLFGLITFSALGQTGFITISAHGPILAKRQDGINYYRNEIKIDAKTGDVYYRKKSSKEFKLANSFKNDSAVLFLKNISYIKLDSIVRKNIYKAEVSYKVEFTQYGTPVGLPSPTLTYILEFGRPIEENKYLDDLIMSYSKLRNKLR